MTKKSFLNVLKEVFARVFVDIGSNYYAYKMFKQGR